MTEVMKFTKQQKMELNLKKCQEMLIDLRRNKTAIPLTEIENNIIEKVNSYKVLGLWIDDNLKWNTNTGGEDNQKSCEAPISFENNKIVWCKYG
jgi:hypothetical protein